jgi:hypothetical protein
MDEPTRWSDPRGGAPPDVRRLLSAARGGPGPIPDAVRIASAAAVSKLGGAALPAGSWTSAKIVGGLALLALAGLAARPRRAPSTGHPPSAAAPILRPAVPLPRVASSPAYAAAPPSEPREPPPTGLLAPLPIVAVPRPSSTSVRPREDADEGVLLERARRGLAAADTASALDTLREHSRRFPHSSLVEERDYLSLVASSRSGSSAEARREAELFLRRHPHGIYSSRVRSVLDGGA